MHWDNRKDISKRWHMEKNRYFVPRQAVIFFLICMLWVSRHLSMTLSHTVRIIWSLYFSFFFFFPSLPSPSYLALFTFPFFFFFFFPYTRGTVGTVCTTWGYLVLFIVLTWRKAIVHCTPFNTASGDGTGIFYCFLLEVVLSCISNVSPSYPLV